MESLSNQEKNEGVDLKTKNLANENDERVSSDVPKSLREAASEIISELEKPKNPNDINLSDIASPQRNYKEDTPKKEKVSSIPKINLVDIPVEKTAVFKKEQTQPIEKKPLFQKTEEPPKPKKSILQNIRTYKSDVANILKKQKTSVTDMIIAEKKKKKTTNKTKVHFNLFKIFGFTTLFVLILGSGFYIVKTQLNKQTIKITELKIPTFIFPDYQRELFLNGVRKSNIINEINKLKEDVSVPLGSIIQIYLTKEDPSKEFSVEKTKGNKLLVNTNVFLTSLETSTPTSLIRAFDSNFILGFHSSLGNNIFLLFHVNSYENAFAGMLQWEKRGLFKDLYPLFKKEGLKINPDEVTFRDIIVENKDVRAVLDNRGKIEFAYSFPNKTTLVIINNRTTLEELFRRTRTSSLERKN